MKSKNRSTALAMLLLLSLTLLACSKTPTKQYNSPINIPMQEYDMNIRDLWASGLEKIETDAPLTKEEKNVRYLIDSDYINLRKKVRVNNG